MGENERLNLLIIDRDVETFFSYRQQKITEGKNFLLSSILFQKFAEVISGVLLGQPVAAAKTKSALRKFYREVNGSSEIIDQPISVKDFNFNYRQVIKGFDPGPDRGGMVSYCCEVLALYGLIVTWLDPQEVNGGQVIAKLWLEDADNNYFFTHRCRQFHSCPTVVDQRFTFVHDSPGILPLCWAELLNAIQLKEKASVCPFCHTVYRFPHSNYQKTTCGSPDCKKAYIIYQHGGLEGYRTWEVERKKAPGGKKGRPNISTRQAGKLLRSLLLLGTDVLIWYNMYGDAFL